jgi:hypothetical protein
MTIDEAITQAWHVSSVATRDESSVSKIGYDCDAIIDLYHKPGDLADWFSRVRRVMGRALSLLDPAAIPDTNAMMVMATWAGLRVGVLERRFACHSEAEWLAYKGTRDGISKGIAVEATIEALRDELNSPTPTFFVQWVVPNLDLWTDEDKAQPAHVYTFDRSADYNINTLDRNNLTILRKALAAMVSCDAAVPCITAPAEAEIRVPKMAATVIIPPDEHKDVAGFAVSPGIETPQSVVLTVMNSNGEHITEHAATWEEAHTAIEVRIERGDWRAKRAVGSTPGLVKSVRMVSPFRAVMLAPLTRMYSETETSVTLHACSHDPGIVANRVLNPLNTAVVNELAREEYDNLERFGQPKFVHFAAFAIPVVDPNWTHRVASGWMTRDGRVAVWESDDIVYETKVPEKYNQLKQILRLNEACAVEGIQRGLATAGCTVKPRAVCLHRERLNWNDVSRGDPYSDLRWSTVESLEKDRQKRAAMRFMQDFIRHETPAQVRSEATQAIMMKSEYG